jgi:hypothetical protein
MRLIRNVRSLGTSWLIGGVGLAVGVALAMPGPTPGGTIHAVMAGADAGLTSSTGTPSSTTTGPTTTTPHHESHGGTTTPTTHPATHPVTTPTTGPSTAPTEPTPTTRPVTDPTTTAPTTSSGEPGPGDASTADCAGTITSFTVTPSDGGRTIILTVMVSGHVGWMSAYAAGFGGAALTPMSGGFRGYIHGTAPIAPGTKVIVGSCHNRVRASTTIGGDGATGPTTAGETTSTTEAGAATGTPAGLPPGCATATITALTTQLSGDGHAVTVTVLVTADVQWMSGEVNGVGGISLRPVTGGFAGTLTSATPIAPGTEVVVGSCGGKLRAHTHIGMTDSTGTSVLPPT